MVETLHIYTRVSTSTQEEEGTSLDTQLEQGLERATKLGFKHQLWNEGGQSSAKDDLLNRPVLTELLHQVDEGVVKHLYVWNNDRLSRNTSMWGMLRYKLIQNDVTLHTPTGEQNLSDPTTNLLVGIMGEISQYDNQIRTERFRLGKLKRIREGGWMGGPPPFGYKLEESKLIPNEDEVRWVKFIFESYSQQMSVDEIRTELMNHGVVTRRGNPVWSHGSINSLLKNSHYGGHYTYKDKKSDETIRITCPTVLDHSLIKSVKESIERRSYGKAGNKRAKTSVKKYTYLLTDLMFCSHCGCRFGGHHKKTQTSYYECLQKTGKYKNTHTARYIDCGSKRNLRIDTTDQVVWDTVINVLSNSHKFREKIKQETLGKRSLRQSTKDIEKVQKQIRKIDLEIKTVSDSIVNINTVKLIGNVDQIDIEKIVENLESHRLSYEVRKEDLIKEIAQETQDRVWIDWLKEFGNRIDELRKPSLTIEEKKRFLDGVVERIDVKSLDKQTHELEIKFLFPYVGDTLMKDEKRKKPSKYNVKDGTNFKKIRANLLKKSNPYKTQEVIIQ